MCIASSFTKHNIHNKVSEYIINIQNQYFYIYNNKFAENKMWKDIPFTLLGIHQKIISYHGCICTSMFTDALFTTKNKISLNNNQQMNGKRKYIVFDKEILFSHKEKNEMSGKYMELENILTGVT